MQKQSTFVILTGLYNSGKLFFKPSQSLRMALQCVYIEGTLSEQQLISRQMREPVVNPGTCLLVWNVFCNKRYF